MDVWIESGLSRANVVEADRDKIDELGRLKSSDLVCPEIDRELARLHEAAAEGDVVIIALRRAVEHSDRSEDPLIKTQYEPIPAEFFKYNEWTFYWPGNFAIAKPYDRETKTGGAFAAEWFYPAVARGSIEACRRNEKSGSLNITGDHVLARIPKGTKKALAAAHIADTYPAGIPAGVSDKLIAVAIKDTKSITIDPRTVRRARTGK